LRDLCLHLPGSLVGELHQGLTIERFSFLIIVHCQLEDGTVAVDRQAAIGDDWIRDDAGIGGATSLRDDANSEQHLD